MSPLETLFLFLVVFCLVLVVAQWRDVPRRTRLDVDPDWRIDQNRERLKAAAIWKGYRRP